jgi:carbamoyl-phosphate synthase large subunit
MSRTRPPRAPPWCGRWAPTPDRILVIAQAFRHGLTVEEVNAACSYEPWFLRQIADIVRTEGHTRVTGLPTDATEFRRLKAKGFSDARLAQLTGVTEKAVRTARRASTSAPCSSASTPAPPSSPRPPPICIRPMRPAPWARSRSANPPNVDKKKAIILGGGPNRIGQGIEFDYCCCHAAFAFADIGVESIMVNCNPETVSTDYDTSDRLYFEPLTAEDVLELIEVERSNGT